MTEDIDEAVVGTVRSIESAAEKEKLARKCGNKRVISPLLRHRIQSRVATTANVLRMNKLDRVMAELEQARAQCGVPTAACMHTRYLVIGTSRGAVFLFDHFQTLITVLGRVGSLCIYYLFLCIIFQYIPTCMIPLSTSYTYILFYLFVYLLRYSNIIIIIIIITQPSPQNPNPESALKGAVTAVEMTLEGDFVIVGHTNGHVRSNFPIIYYLLFHFIQ